MRISDWSSDVCSSDLLVDSADDAIPLKLEQLVPDGRVADARRGLDNPLLVQLVAQIPEQLVEHLKIKQRRWAMADRKSVVSGKSVSVRVDLGGRRIIKKKRRRDT